MLGTTLRDFYVRNSLWLWAHGIVASDPLGSVQTFPDDGSDIGGGIVSLCDESRMVWFLEDSLPVMGDGYSTICKTSPFDKIKPKEQQPEPGHFFRTSDSAKTIDGIYTRAALYYNQSLFSDSKESTITKQKIMGLDRTKAKNYLAAFFFGIWSYGPENSTIQEVEVPIREIVRSKSSKSDDKSDEEAMYTLKDDGTYSYGPRMIWKTDHDLQENDNDDKKIFLYTL